MEPDELILMLIDANHACRIALRTVNGLATKRETHIDGFNMGAVADMLDRVIKRQQDVIDKYHARVL